MDPRQRPHTAADHADSEHARFWGEPAEDRQDEFDEK